MDRTADEGLFIYRLSGLYKPDELTNNSKAKSTTKLGSVLGCLCSGRYNVFPRKKLDSFFIRGTGKEQNFSSNTKVSPEEMKEPILETNFYYVVALLEGLGFCNVKDVHDGSRN